MLVDSQGTGDNRRSDVKLDTLIMYISLQLSSVQVLNVEKYLTSDVMISLQVINQVFQATKAQPQCSLI